MPLILAISDKLRSVKVIRCVDSHIDGESLISLVSQLQKTGNNQINSKLSTVVIDCCTGITRVQCEQLAGLVEKLVIHV
ncbi:hypothetical protein M408DRAFT_333207 [Serendipita vermifera MAFF 305830]|uniref:Uncharacterized protein n=1 Tax=Serendipita vermifera MAFF 305830 TaxID=933852 RepID=A0A0C2W611_SERVB|nr:hypothetical protein M408DRAFT_333207 [Serendipita vermifera MAFF 305830]